MRKLFFLLSAAFFINLSSAQENRDSLIQVVKNKIDSLPNGFAISVALLKNGEIYHIGFIKQDDELVYSDLKDSLFEIGSLTKVFTSTVLANEVLSGNVKLTASVNKAFSYKFNDKIKLTYQSLANHTSGMYRLPANLMPFLFKNQANPYSEYSYDLFDYYLIKELQIEQNDIPKYSYSNLGAGLLAYSLSNNANLKFKSLLQENIFNKYNMSATGYDNITSFNGIDASENKTENWEFNALKGAGGLISSTNDLAKFVSAQFDLGNAELNLTRKETFSISKDMSIGLGWHILEPQTENKKFWHNGGTGGYTSSISFKTTNKIGVIILSNISALHPRSIVIDELCFVLLDFIK